MATYNIKQIITPDGDVCKLDTPGSKIWTSDSISGSSSPYSITTRSGGFVRDVGNVLILELGDKTIAGDLTASINVDGTGNCAFLNPSGEAVSHTDVILVMTTTDVFTVVGFLNYNTTPGRGLSYQNINDVGKEKTLANESPAWYCTCATASGTAAKVLTSTNGNFSNPTDGDIITVRFAEGDVGPTQTTTLNIDGSGAYELNRGNLMGSIWGNGGHQTFVFRGSKWYTVDVHQALSGVLGVVMLSNAADSSLGTNGGYAATPKAVADATAIGSLTASVASATVSVASTTTSTTLLGSITLKPGFNVIQAKAVFPNNTVGFRKMGFTTNSSASTTLPLTSIQVSYPPVNGAQTVIQASMPTIVTATTTIYVKAQQNSGAALTVTPTITGIWMAGTQ